MKKERILEAAEELFAEKGFEGTSVRDIAQKAEINLAMISYYFGSKEKLLESLILYRYSYSAGLLEELNQDTTLDPMEKMERVIEFYVDRVMSNHRFHNIIGRQISLISDKKLQDLMVDIKLQNLELVRRIIQEGQKRQIFQEVDIELTMSSIMGTISQLTLSKPLYCRIIGKENLSDAEYLDQMKVRLKVHLKHLIKAHLDIKNQRA